MSARRHSLLIRFFAFSVLIAASSIAATAWLATQATTGDIRQEQGEALATGAKLYDQLLRYGAEHKDWSGVRPVLDRMQRETGLRIALTTPERKAVADSGGKDAPQLPVRQTAVVDPLLVDLDLKPDAPPDRIDARAVGPYRLGAQEAQVTRLIAEKAISCARDGNPLAAMVTKPNGRTTIEATDGSSLYQGTLPDRCYRAIGAVEEATPTERTANTELVGILTDCLDNLSPPIQLIEPRNKPQSSPSAQALVFADATRADMLRDMGRQRERAPEIDQCVTAARRQLLTRYVARPALMFLTAPTGREPAKADLSTAGTTRIALTALAILTVAALAAWVAAAQFVRPIRAITAAARRMGGGDRSVRVKAGKGEIGELAAAFNTMSRELEATEQQRKAMVSDVAHELRTPLGNITGWLEATQDGLATPDPELIAMLLNESFLLQYLVSDLQDLAQADAGALRLHPESIDARDLVDQVTAAHQAQADENDVRLRAATRGQLDLTADPARLQQALGNLVSNAIRYTPRGGEVTVTGTRQGDLIVLEVSDTGVGIAEEDLPHVFDRFWRADKSRSRRTGGSGLGLAITRHLAEAHGGAVTAHSVIGTGSTFRMTLPADPVGGSAPETRAAKPPPVPTSARTP